MSAADFDPVFQSAGQQYNVDPAILKALAQQESDFNPKAVNPDTGATGIMQYIPASAKAAGLDPNDPVASINQAAKDFAGNMQRFNGNVEQAVAAHFAGPNQAQWGPKTSQYVSDVANKYAALKQSGGYAPAPAATTAPTAQVGQSDPVDTMLAQRAQGQQPTPPAPDGSAPDPVDAMLAARASGQSVQPMTASGVSSAPTIGPAQPQGQWQPPGSFGMGVGDAVGGAVQDIVHGLSWAADKIAPDSQFAKDARASLPQIQQTIDQQNSIYNQQRAAQGEKGVDWGRLGGNIVGTAPTMLVSPEAGASLPVRLAAGAVQGGIGAGMMPTTGDSDQTFGQQKLTQVGVGSALGAATPAVTGIGRWVGKNIWNTVQPVVQPGRFVGQGLASAMDPTEAAQAAGNIRNAPQFVPGSAPTTAQAAATPTLVQTEKAAGNIPQFKTALTNRLIDNNDARWSALMGVAQDPAALDAANQARSAAAQPLYDAAHQATANVGPAFTRYAQIPEMQEAMQRANAIATLNSATGRGVAPVWPTPQSKVINGAALDYTSRALGDMIGEAANQPTRAGALRALQQKVDSWTQSYIPGVQQADAAYATASVPINTMTAAQRIANSLGTRAMNAGGAPEIQLNPYRTALTQATTAQPYGIDANALQSLQGIGQDLQRGTISNSIKSPGSDTAYNIAANGWLAKNLYGPNFGGATGLGKTAAAAAALFTGHPLTAGGIFAGGNRVGQMVGSRLQGQLSNYLLDPQSVLPYLDARAAAPTQSIQQALAKRLLSYGRPAIVNGLSSQLVNGQNH